MDTYAIDFETVWSDEYSVKASTPTRYCLDPRFGAYLVAIHGPGISYVGPVKTAPWGDVAGKHWVSHNAAFDAQVWLRLLHDGEVCGGPSDWTCTADLSSWCQGPRSLKDAAAAWLGKEVSKDYRKIAKGTDGITLAGVKAVRDAATLDAAICLELWHKLEAKWPQHERDLSLWTWNWGAQGVGVDLDGLREDDRTLTTQFDAAVKLLPWVSAGEKPLSPMAARRQCEREGIPAPASFAQNDEECAAWEDEHAGDRPWIDGLRTARRVNRLRAVVRAMLGRAIRTPSGGERVTYGMKYCGAPHTGRWSGDSGLNVQNLPREAMYGVDIRGRLIAAPGNKLVAVDLSQIEPRVLAWLADDRAFLQRLVGSGDLYDAYARSKGLWSGPQDLKAGDRRLRDKLKGIFLGAQYGASGDALSRASRGSFDSTVGARLSREYRRQNPATVALWKRLQLEFTASTGSDYVVQLPSGREIVYRDVSDGRARKVLGEPPERFWGSKLVENVVQATAREVFAHDLRQIQLEVDAQILFHVHDEVVLECPAERADDVAAQVVKIMATSPDWLAGCPLAAEAQILDKYTK